MDAEIQKIMRNIPSMDKLLALRTAAGIERAEFAREYGAAALSRVERIMGGFPKNLYESDERGIRLTKSGMRVANLIWDELV